MAGLEVRNLVVRYGNIVALDGVDLVIGSGEMFVLLGGSGSGKTTLLRTLGGFIAPSAGRILLGGQDITALPPHRRPVNTTFQSYALFPHMTVADNVAFGLRRQGTPKAEIEPRVRDLLALVRLQDFAGRRPDALSGGQRQRVALARALAPRPRLLLLDEPMSALDRSLREQTRHELLRIQRETGTTFVLVTHDQDEALSMATRIGLLNGGRLEQVGTPAEIYERPATRYAASFMGGANILPATLLQAEPHAVLEVPALGTPHATVHATGPAPHARGTAIHLALRPERLRLELQDPGPQASQGPQAGQGPQASQGPQAGKAGHAPNRTVGTVEDVAYHGDAAHLTVRLPGGTALVVNCPLGHGATAIPARGDPATVTWPPDACVLLAE